MTSLKEIMQTAKRDPSLFSTLDIENLLAIDYDKHVFLENKTMTQIVKDVYDQLSSMVPEHDLATLCAKLMDYRFVDEIHELQKGKHVRWIRRSHNGTITNGGIVVNVKFTNTGTQVIVKNSQNRFIQYSFEQTATFQKMSPEEQLIVLANEHK